MEMLVPKKILLFFFFKNSWVALNKHPAEQMVDSSWTSSGTVGSVLGLEPGAGSWALLPSLPQTVQWAQANVLSRYTWLSMKLKGGFSGLF